MSPETAPSDTTVRHVPSPPDRDVYVLDEYEHGPTDYGRRTAAIKRISWGAIFAGAVAAVATHFLLHLLGIGIGFETFDPASENDTVGGLGAMQGIWLVVSGLVALFVGGWVAGRLAGMPRKTDGALHGFVVWGLTTLITLYFLTSGVGTLVSGVTGALGQGAQLLGQGVAAVAPQVSDAAGLDDVDLSPIRQEAARLIEDVATTPADAGADLDAAIDRTFGGPGPVTASNREELVETLAANSTLTEPEARQTVSQWETQAEQARSQAQQAVESVRTDAPGVAEDAAELLGSAALWSFFALLLGAAAAVFGGLTGSPEALPVRTDRRETV